MQHTFRDQEWLGCLKDGGYGDTRELSPQRRRDARMLVPSRAVAASDATLGADRCAIRHERRRDLCFDGPPSARHAYLSDANDEVVGRLDLGHATVPSPSRARDVASCTCARACARAGVSATQSPLYNCTIPEPLT